MEQVSMVPVACLDIQPNHAVLDMCASPGSKTGQVLEAMQIRLFQGEIPSGFLIANEPDLKRCKVLAGNMKLFSSPCIMVTNFRGEDIPDMKQGDGQPLLFDRIICDVPCSGDGTIRKNPNVWNNWNPARGNERFSLQLNIARRGVHLLKEEGLMAYSSCSMNQIENEAVVAQLLEESEGLIHIFSPKVRSLAGS
ncbi:tRNA (cytosine(34)-C(5))-methyltransferase [Eurytemora carolleeae]|uniref:tRNA (cytosine(34)-C(5))-methyltransferase n=1 Tax=Eurytemora carolleeae TaxID=1294199 RepID=UPI000C7896AB|nr:tRNA (cytosine(34)-C(5))-methyltransferase [Eurytemora carolleeae]|eukprot:XP_023334264.1 tRNA (cytosine(34)-C(5))-methyltransferase-like [Eurytemora affinis]